MNVICSLSSRSRGENSLRGFVVPSMDMSSDFLTTLVAIFGTTISPYLFIRQSSQEAEDQRIDAAKLPLKQDLKEAAPECRRIRIDRHGLLESDRPGDYHHDSGRTSCARRHGYKSSAQAAEALRPLAGSLPR
jgi:hypothetical protein